MMAVKDSILLFMLESHLVHNKKLVALSDISKHINKSYEYTSQEIKRMKESGIIEKTKPDKNRKNLRVDDRYTTMEIYNLFKKIETMENKR